MLVNLITPSAAHSTSLSFPFISHGYTGPAGWLIVGLSDRLACLQGDVRMIQTSA